MYSNMLLMDKNIFYDFRKWLLIYFNFRLGDRILYLCSQKKDYNLKWCLYVAMNLCKISSFFLRNFEFIRRGLTLIKNFLFSLTVFKTHFSSYFFPCFIKKVAVRMAHQSFSQITLLINTFEIKMYLSASGYNLLYPNILH